MKIKCEYCENFFDDTLEQCPHCGAPNKNVRRSTADQPVTVEELQEWYTKQGLPPAEVTRFFIGEDYKDPKAFGIYKDANTGNFVVYKNKADGSRAVRYEGTDEAFAVNEIFMRLKQEILEQKAHNLKSDSKANSSGNGVSETGTSQEASKTGKSSKPPKWLIIVLVAIFGQGVFFVAFMIFSLISGMVKGFNIPNTGYYQKDGQTYYYYSESNHDVWAVYDNNDWVETEVNGELLKWKTAKPYYKGNAFNDGLGTSDFTQSILYDDVVHECTQGYYRAEDRDYYYLLTDGGLKPQDMIIVIELREAVEKGKGVSYILGGTDSEREERKNGDARSTVGTENKEKASNIGGIKGSRAEHAGGNSNIHQFSRGD